MKTNDKTYSLDTEICVAAIGLLLNLLLAAVSIATLWYLFSAIFQSSRMFWQAVI
jgi:hypothetical protein